MVVDFVKTARFSSMRIAVELRYRDPKKMGKVYLLPEGVTREVTFEVTAEATAERIGVLGNIPVLFSDYDIDNPSFGAVTTEDDGLLEFVLVFERA